MEKFKLVSKNEKMIEYYDEEIYVRWRISLNAKRFYRNAEALSSIQTHDIKYPDNLTESEAIDLLFTKAEKYRKRVLKVGGWNVRAGSCGHAATLITLTGDPSNPFNSIYQNLPQDQSIKWRELDMETRLTKRLNL